MASQDPCARARRGWVALMKNKNFAVGMFVSIALLIIFVATIWLTGNRGTEPTVDYSMYFESDVGGLMLGGPVFFLGVKVGSVTGMTIIPGNPMRIRVDAEVLKKTPINTGTYATLALQGVTGVAVIRLKADPGEYPPLVKVAGEENLLINTRASGFSALLQKAPEIVEKLDVALLQVNALLGDENINNINQMLADFAAISGSLAARKESIGEIPVAMNAAINDLRATLSELQSIAVEFKPQLNSSMSHLNDATENLAGVSDRLKIWADENGEKVDVIMEDGLGQIPALVVDARVTIREFKKLINELRENPSQLVYKPNEESVDVEK